MGCLKWVGAIIALLFAFAVLRPLIDPDGHARSQAELKAKADARAAKTAAGEAQADGSPNPNITGEQMWVTSQYLDRHTCPSSSCGVVGRLFFRESADVQERKNGWARVSRRYDASCVGGRSEYVDKGNARCTSANGIENGQFAEWVRLSSLSATRPADPAATASP
ncbi:MAG TPA: hypothetical protein VF606_09480, partial [Geminicoccaceae bacterium]